MMLNISRIMRTTCATAPVCRIRLKISPPITAAKTGANTDAKTGETMGAAMPPAMDANRGKCEIIIAKSTASIS
jgi:hypothetical protein